MAENKREISDGAAANDEQGLVKPNSIVWDKVAAAIRKYMPDGQDDWDMLCDIEDAVAAALAACAREELQSLLTEHETTIEDDFGGWDVVRAKDIRKRIEALEAERAVGEKGKA